MKHNDSDQLARNKIRSNTNANYFVEAGAGSGKTSVLVDRMVAMIENGIDISKICAITFTKAAAGEFYARFQKKLSESQSENARKALQNIDLCFMGTIDSFCSMILSEHPAKAGIPSDAQVISEKERVQLYSQLYIGIQNGKFGEDLRRYARQFKRCFYNHNDVFLKGVTIVSDNKNVEFQYTPLPSEDVDSLFAAEKSRVLSALDILKNHPEAMPVKSEKTSTKAWEVLQNDSAELFDSWSENFSGVMGKLKLLQKLRISPDFDLALLGPGYDHLFVPHTSRNKLSHYEVNIEDDAFMVKILTNYQMNVAMNFIVPAAKRISEQLRKQGKLTFSDYLVYLRDMLKSDAEAGGTLIRHIYNRHSYFLIDEFQDTNPLQAEIFFYLTAKSPVPDWTKCQPEPGSLFIVGDPKQSIYRFRCADVAAFIRVRTLFANPEVGEVLYLTRNFRSSDPMCEWLNQTFTGLLPEDTQIQSRFNEIPLGEKQPYNGTLNGIYSYSVLLTRKIADCDDPQKVADIIRRIVCHEEITIQDRDENGCACLPRPAQYRDFMLITPGKEHLGYYVKALSDAGIPFRIEGKVILNDSPALLALSKLLSAVARPFDKHCIFAATTLSGCKISTEKILDYHNRAKQMSPSGVYNMLLEEEAVFANLGTQNVEYVYFALELLRNAQISGEISSLSDAAEYLKNMIDDDRALERCVQLKPDANCVHVANLHKVKGLEAPIVILADPQKRTQSPALRIDCNSVPPKGWIFELPEKLRTTAYTEEEALERDVLQSETMRLLYVAATRAANALIIAEGIKSDGSLSDTNPWSRLLSPDTAKIFDLLPNDLHAAEKDVKKLHIPTLYNEAQETSVLNDRSCEEKSYEIIRPSTIAISSKLSSEEDYTAEVAEQLYENTKKNVNPALLGTMVHKLMEALVTSGNTVSLSDLVSEICRDYAAAEDEYSERLLGVGNKMRTGGYPQDGSVPQDILSELLTADEVHCEVPFCYAEPADTAKIWNGVMDVVYRKNDSWHIIDYKTNADASDLDKHYQAQLSAYIAAFKAITSEDADARVYHIETRV